MPGGTKGDSAHAPARGHRPHGYTASLGGVARTFQIEASRYADVVKGSLPAAVMRLDLSGGSDRGAGCCVAAGAHTWPSAIHASAPGRSTARQEHPQHCWNVAVVCGEAAFKIVTAWQCLCGWPSCVAGVASWRCSGYMSPAQCGTGDVGRRCAVRIRALDRWQLDQRGASTGPATRGSETQQYGSPVEVRATFQRANRGQLLRTGWAAELFRSSLGTSALPRLAPRRVVRP
eukprot:SAG22_NODE_2658_length_2330_cov_2.505155_3_plen_232_part_00